jgi:rRNA maturation RNase YbeY
MKNYRISVFKEDVAFRLNAKEKLFKWLRIAAAKEKFSIEALNYIFCSDKFLRKMNVKYLEHDYFTDIITFDNSTEKKKIIGDIFISIDRIRINAKQYETTFDDELHRVMIHGLLHLVGYSDKSVSQKKEMRKMEDYWLNYLNKLTK